MASEIGLLTHSSRNCPAQGLSCRVYALGSFIKSSFLVHVSRQTEEMTEKKS